MTRARTLADLGSAPLATDAELASAVADKVSTDGGDTITASGPSVVPLTLKGASGQTASLVDLRDSSSTSRFTASSTGKVDVIGTANNSGPGRFRISGGAVNNGFYEKEVFRLAGIPSTATEITRLTLTNGNGWRGYIRVVVTGHTSATSNATNIKEFAWDAQGTTPIQISSTTNGTVPIISLTVPTPGICVVNLASAAAGQQFNGAMMVEWLIPLDFIGTEATIS